MKYFNFPNVFMGNIIKKKNKKKTNKLGNKLILFEIDDSTPVSQSIHTLRFQPIACRSIMRCPRVLTRPKMVWQAFVPDIANSQLAVFDMAEKQQQENGIFAMASVSQTNDTLSNVQVSHSSRFRSQKQG